MISKFRNLSILGFLILVTPFIACNSAKRLSGEKKVKERSADYVVKQLTEKKFQVDDFNARAKVKYDDGDQRISFVAQLRMKKSQYIWISASFLSYEVARILIRPDSIFAINRLEKSFVSDSYDNFNQSYEIPASYNQLEQLLLGNSIIDDQRPYDFQFQTDHYLISQNLEPIHLSERINSQELRADKIEVTDEESHYRVSAQYDDFRNWIQSKEFSYFRQYIIEKDDIHLANIQLNFSDIDTNEKKAPFEIPKHYERMD
ncbi:MAG: DUF4292 domain-containing protein [Saprospiraceae bacterium]|nr:DUF4292 domain-containing protein [Saprospiraceae bacterium]